MRHALLLLAVLLISACASVGQRDRASLLHDELFAQPSAPVAADQVFALTPAMRAFIEREIPRAAKSRGPRMALVDALNDRAQLRVEYDSARTRNAGEAFAERSGNCLSLVLMTAALARQLGIEVQFQIVYTEETWARQGDVYLSVGHVNLALVRSRADTGTERITIDFVPPSQVRGFRTHVIAESTVMAMYMNNRAVESLTAGRLDDAYWHAREAMRRDPYFLSAVNTLGAVYRLHGNPGEAEAAFRAVLEQEPANTTAMANLVPLLRDLGRSDQAEALARRLAAIEPYPAFHFYRLGLAAIREGDFTAAKAMFSREVARAAYYHEFHYWLAVALFQLGDTVEARRHLRVAIETSPRGDERDLYSAKLAWINSHGRL